MMMELMCTDNREAIRLFFPPGLVSVCVFSDGVSTAKWTCIIPLFYSLGSYYGA